MPAQTWRRVSLVVLVPLACLAIVAASITVWVHQTLLDTDRWVATVGPLINDPRITEPLSAYLADQMVATLQIQTRAQQALPSQAAFLAEPLTDSTGRFIQSTILKLLTSESGQNAWITANRVGHDRLVALLRGQSQFLGSANGMVTLDLTSLAVAALRRIGEAAPGLLPRPGLLQDAPPGQSADEQRRDLGQRMGVAIPEDFGQVPLFPESQLDAAQRGLRLLDGVTIALPLIALALAIAVLLVAADPWHGALYLAVSSAVAFVLTQMVLPEAISFVSSQASGQAARDVVHATLTLLSESLARLLTLGAILSGIAAGILGLVVRRQHVVTPQAGREAELAPSPGH